MATSLVGVLNGTDVVILMDDGINFILIGGQTSHSTSLTFEPIAIDNKSAPRFRELLTGEGLKTAEVTMEVLFSTDAGYELMQQKFDDKEFADIQVRYLSDLTRVHEIKVLITAISEPVEQNSAVTSSVTMMSTDAFLLDSDVSPP